MDKIKKYARRGGAIGVLVAGYIIIYIIAYWAGHGLGKLFNKIWGNKE